MVELGLNSHHQAVVLNYMKFARYLRGQSVRTVDSDFQRAKNVLFDDTFTQDEVKKILDDLRELLVADVESEICSFTHNNVLMLQQLFSQAEKWHLRLEVHLSELQNRDLLEKIRLLEVDESVLKPAKEEKIGENAVALLRMEIERLREENERIENIKQECVDKLEETQEELASARGKLQDASAQIEAYSKISPFTVTPEIDSEKVAEMAEKLRHVQDLLKTDQESSRLRHATLVNELNSTREQVAQVRSQLKLAEMELERKFSETKAYANMKHILMKKNEQIRRLRAKLQSLGKTENESEEDEE